MVHSDRQETVLRELAHLLDTTPASAADELRRHGVTIDPHDCDAHSLLEALGRVTWAHDIWPD